MKKLQLLKTLFLLFALVVGTGSAWGASSTYSFSSIPTKGWSTSGGTQTINGKAWTYSSATFISGANSKIQVGSGNNPQTSNWTIQTAVSNFGDNKVITQVSITAYTTATTATYDISVDGSSVKSGSLTTSADTYTASSLNATDGNIVITLKGSSNSKAMYLSNISVTYEDYVSNKVSTPSITIPTTTPFVSSKTVTMSSGTDGASIYYTMTTDGTTPAEPTTSSTLYDPENKPVITSSATFKAIGVKDGMTNSSVITQSFTKETVYDGISALNSALTSTSASYYVNLTDAQVTYVNGSNGYLNDATAGIYIYKVSQTLNTKYNGVYRITGKTYYGWPEITAFTAIDGEGTSEVAAEDVAPIVISASTLEENFSDYISRPVKIINHTLSGVNLTSNITNVTTYIGSGIIASNGTYTLTGYPSVYNTGKRFNVVTAYPKPAAPTFDPIEGEFSEAFTLHLACATDGVTIYYTTNGDTPTTSSTVYNDATGIAIPNASTTVKAIAYYEGMTSDVASATYDYRVVAKPQFSVADLSELYYGETVSITCATDGADIYYTVDGTTPTSSSTKYTAPVAITDLVEINAIAIKGSDESSVATATYAVKAPAAPTFNVEAGAVARNTVVTISSREGTTIWYSTDGTDPSVDAEGNTKEITITAGMTVRAIAIDPLDNDSPETFATYTIAQVATPVIDTAAGMLSKGTQVHITTATDGASIYYTLDGTTPTASSNPYNGYVVISKAETLKAIAIKENYIDSEIASVAYTVAGDNEGFVFKDLGYKNAATVKTVSGTDVQLEFADGTNKSNSPSYYDTGEAVRLYQNNTLTISSEAKTIIAIRFTFVSGYATLALSTGQPGTLSDVASSQRTWTGSASSIQFTTSAANRIKSITVYFALSDDAATVGSSKLAGYCSEYKLDYSETGLKAYKAKVDGEGNVVLTQIADGIVPANEGVILSGNADDYNIPISTADVTADFSDNEMVGVTQRTLVEWTSTDGKHNYILQQGEFNKATDGYLKPNRAYLHTTFDVSASPANKMTIIFNDSETDGIRSIENGKLNIETSAYNLSGQRVGNDYKGFVIINGKKVIRK